MTSEARARVPEETDASGMPASTGPGDRPIEATHTGNPDAGGTEKPASGAGKADDTWEAAGAVGGDPVRRRSRLVAALAVLLVLLLAGAGVLWFTRPTASAVSTGDYAQALQAARSGVVDLTSFDYLTLDDDIEQVRRVATGDLKDESVKQLDGRRKQITDAQAVVNTEVVGAGVTRADDSSATVLLVIQSTQASTATPKPQIVRYRIEVSLEKKGERWLLSGIKGTGNPSDK